MATPTSKTRCPSTARRRRRMQAPPEEFLYLACLHRARA